MRAPKPRLALFAARPGARRHGARRRLRERAPHRRRQRRDHRQRRLLAEGAAPQPHRPDRDPRRRQRLTTTGDYPPILKTITIEYDKHGAVQTRGLPVCTKGKLSNTTVKQARHNCPGAIVGKGFGKAVVVFPDSKPIPASSPITVFNGPKSHGRYTVLGHAYTTVPAPTTFIVPVVIERIHKGRYGYRTKINIPPIAGGYGIPLSGHVKINRKWRYKKHRYSFVNASCPDGHLQARGAFDLSDGKHLTGTFVRSCIIRR